jgi:peptidoglycan hydrolase FlgJ
MTLNDIQTRTAEAAAQKDPAREKMKKACHEMEGYFVGMLMKQMHEAAAKGGLFEEKSESATYRSMFDDAVAAKIGERGSFGIADMLYRELSKRDDAEIVFEPSRDPAAPEAKR